MSTIGNRAKAALECKSEDGITIGLIDAIMACAEALKTRNLHQCRESKKTSDHDLMSRVGILNALMDLKHNGALRELLCGKLPLLHPENGKHTVGTLIEKLQRFPRSCPVVLSVEEDYSGPAAIVSIEPQGIVIISDEP